MRRNDRTSISLLAGLVAAMGTRAAFAVEPSGCAPLVVDADAGVRDRWPDLPTQIQSAFEVRADIDTCARIDLAMAHSAILLRIALPDGRTASRLVSRTEDVLPALEALLLLPLDGAAASGQLPDEATPPSDARVNAVTPATHGEIALSQRIVQHSAPVPAGVPSRLGVDLSLAAGARVGDGHMGVGLDLVSFLEVGHWLLGFQGQLNLYQPVGAGDLQQPMVDGARAVALELGILGGHRFPCHSGTLDLAVGPALALHATTSSMTQQAPAGTAVTQTTSSDGGLPRAVASSRFSFGHRSSLRTFVEADGEIGRTGTSALTGAPRLPAWTVGLAFGVVVGTP